MCERKVKKDAPATVVSRAVCVSRNPPADASRLALSGWGRPAWSLRVNPLLTIPYAPKAPVVLTWIGHMSCDPSLT